MVKPVVFNAYTCDGNVYELYKPEPSTHNLPDWFKDLATKFTVEDSGFQLQSPTMRRCPGVIDYFKHSFTVPISHDILIIARDGDSSYYLPNAGLLSRVKTFNAELLGAFPAAHLKLETGWIMEEEEGIPVLYTDAYYNNLDKPWRVTQGIMNFKDGRAVMCNLTFPINMDQIMISSGTPLMNMIPLTDRPYKIKTHLISEGEFKQRVDSRHKKSAFVNFYDKHIKRTKRNNSDHKDYLW